MSVLRYILDYPRVLVGMVLFDGQTFHQIRVYSIWTYWRSEGS